MNVLGKENAIFVRARRIIGGSSYQEFRSLQRNHHS